VWSSRKLYSIGAIVVGVADMDRAVAWYCDKLGLSFESKEPGSREVYLGHPSGDLDMIPMIILVPIPRGKPTFMPIDTRFVHKETGCGICRICLPGNPDGADSKRLRRKSILQVARLGRQYYRSVRNQRRLPIRIPGWLAVLDEGVK
jgi:glyoxalase/bleomycin resistance protein/dioxygenase superfamily protein